MKGIKECLLSLYSLGYSTEYHIYLTFSLPKEIKAIRSIFKTQSSLGYSTKKEISLCSILSRLFILSFLSLVCLLEFFLFSIRSAVISKI